MPKNFKTSYRNVIAWVTGSLLVLQVLIPGGFNIPTPSAKAATGSWEFDLAADYTTLNNVTVSGGYAVTDLDYTDATDSLDGYNATTDVLQLASGRVIAAVDSADSHPYSTDSGATWTAPAACGGLSSFVKTKLALSGNRVLAAGYNSGTGLGSMGYSDNDGECWSAATVPANVTRFTAVADGGVALYAGSGGGVLANDGKIFVSNDNGANWSKTGADPTNLTHIQSIVAYGARIIVAGTRSAGHDTLSGVYYSDNFGASWTEVSANAGNTHSIVYAMDIDPNGVLYATTNQNYVLKGSGSALGAFTFSRVVAASSASARAIHITDLGDIFVGATAGRMVRSVDGGSTFFLSNTSAVGPVITYAMIRMTKTTNYFLLAVSDGGGGSAFRGFFATAAKSLVNNNGVAYNTISEFIETVSSRSESTGTYYRISKTALGGPWVYWDGDSWESSDDVSKVNAASVIHANVESFNATVGAGTFFFYATMDPIPGTTNPSLILDKVSITYDAASLTVTSPNGGESWRVGSTQNITWTDVGLGGGDLITLSYSLDNGGAWNNIVVGTANDGSYTWTVPTQTSTQALVKAVSGAVEDQSNAVFSIVGGSPPPGDKTAPTSDVDDLSQYQTNSTFPVSVTAFDNQGGAGVAEVYLYYTYGSPAANRNNLIQFGTKRTGCPLQCFTWDFDSPFGDGQYYFYSSAKDSAIPTNDNWNSKFSPYVNVEASTWVDSQAPFVASSQPTQGQTEVAEDGSIVIDMSEEMNHDLSGLDYYFYKLVGGQKISAMDKLGTPAWVQVGGNPVYDQIEVPYTNLERGVTYTFTIRHFRDLASNDIQKNGFEPPASTPVWMLNFTTAPVLDPDLTKSKIQISNLPASGKFNPGDKASFRITLENDSNTVANNVTVSLTVASGLTYCSAAAQGCSAANSSQNPQPVVTQNGNNYVITWGPGTVVKGTPVTINFDTKVNNPALLLSTVQSVIVDDGVHDELTRSVTLNIQKNPNFSTSTKVGLCIYQSEDGDGNIRYEQKPCTDAVLGTQITYVITARNSGNTPSNVEVSDAIPAGLQFGMITDATGWDTASYDPTSRILQATGTLLPGSVRTLEFIATVNQQGAEDLYITNTAVIKDTDLELADKSKVVSFTTKVPGVSSPPDFPLQIVSQVPANNQYGVSPYAKIEVGFSKSVNLSTFDFRVFIGEEEIEVDGWKVEWSVYPGSSLPNSYATLISDVPFDQGETYIVEIDKDDSDKDGKLIRDTDGNALVPSNYSNPWSFTIVDPIVRITRPQGLVEVGANLVSPAFTVEIQDQHSKAAYKVEENIELGVYAEIPATGLPGFFRDISETALFGTNPDGNGFVQSTGKQVFHITVPKGRSQATFYFRESVPGTLTLIAYPDPYRGWSRGEKTVVVTTDLNQNLDRLQINGPSSVEADKMSGAIMVSAKSKTDATMLLPNKLYFYTESTTGAFYDSSFKKLPQLLTASAVNPTTNLQYAEGIIGEAAAFYYKDSQAQTSLITISDNAPLAPDTLLNNANLILQVFNPLPEEEELLEELEEVEDDSGRKISELVIEPDYAAILPGGIKSFKATGYDTDGKEVKNIKVKWYAVAGGGTVLKDGLEDDNLSTIFTAGQKTGTFYDTVLVATLYNKKFAFATATVKVTDVVTYNGPARLPTTGFSGLQMIFMALTLAAAVALAWVEHYEKTHFKND